MAQVRAGTGGEEAALWAADLVRMYSKYADAQGWRTARIAESQAESGGVKETILQVRTPAWLPPRADAVCPAGRDSVKEAISQARMPGASLLCGCCCVSNSEAENFGGMREDALQAQALADALLPRPSPDLPLPRLLFS